MGDTAGGKEVERSRTINADENTIRTEIRVLNTLLV
jgi:hypothetical protein